MIKKDGIPSFIKRVADKFKGYYTQVNKNTWKIESGTCDLNIVIEGSNLTRQIIVHGEVDKRFHHIFHYLCSKASRVVNLTNAQNSKLYCENDYLNRFSHNVVINSATYNR